MPRFFRNAAAIVILIPLLPFAAINLLGESLVAFSNWAADRAWAHRLLDKANQIGR